jgi:glyoxylase-like metal-dependent hydrolase (beta-lactamase superfamily II)
MIPLEDSFSDVIGKAQRGLRLSDTELAEKARVSSQKIRALREGDFDELALVRVAPVLGLAARQLCDLAQGQWQPKRAAKIDGFELFTTHYHDMTVNAYLVWDPGSKQAVAFDTGADCTGMLQTANKNNLTVKLILLTHAHPDHIADLARLRSETDAPVFTPEDELAPGATAFEEGKYWQVGGLHIDTRKTWGHSPGGMTYVVNGLSRKLAIVGDAIFAGSMGGGNVSYRDALQTNIDKILTLPDETVICPGHGPLTTVGEEKQHNPFFAGIVDE